MRNIVSELEDNGHAFMSELLDIEKFDEFSKEEYDKLRALYLCYVELRQRYQSLKTTYFNLLNILAPETPD
jgi:hypothetical protein